MSHQDDAQEPWELPDTGAHLNQPVAHRAVTGGALASRFIAIFAILGTLISAIAVYIYGAAFVVLTVWDSLTSGRPSEEGLKHLTLQLVESTDAFLLGTVLYIVSIGFFQLFIDSDLNIPGWMRITNLDQLKSKLIGVIVVLLGVTFLGKVSNWRAGTDIVYLGIAVAVVIASLAYFGFRAHEKH
jgi:uncharacterized membrane protein YqhA